METVLFHIGCTVLSNLINYLATKNKVQALNHKVELGKQTSSAENAMIQAQVGAVQSTVATIVAPAVSSSPAAPDAKTL